MPKTFARNKTGKNRYGEGRRTSKRTLGFQPTFELEAIIDAESEEQGITRAEWVKRAIAFYLLHRAEHQ